MPSYHDRDSRGDARGEKRRYRDDEPSSKHGEKDDYEDRRGRRRRASRSRDGNSDADDGSRRSSQNVRRRRYDEDGHKNRDERRNGRKEHREERNDDDDDLRSKRKNSIDRPQHAERERAKTRKESGIEDDTGLKEYHKGKASKEDWGLDDKKDKDGDQKEKAKPDYGKSGKLEKANKARKNGIPLKHSEPPNASIPNKHWRIYVFKDEENIATLHIHRQSCFIIGRERRVADIKTDHLTCSKQHAVIQFKIKAKTDELGNNVAEVRPYILDLDSANGTFLNKKRVESRRYYELLDKDVLNFGSSSRDYVLMVVED
eukprot:jgi/Bigna1/51698/estExt_Genewise1Plus.C_20273